MLYSLLIFTFCISWLIVYISFIRNGRKEKTYCMPFFCVMNEIMWDGLYTCKTIQNDMSVQTFFFGTYGVCALIFLIQYIKYRKEAFPAILRRHEKIYVLCSIVSAIAIQISFLYMWSYPFNMIYTAYIHTFVISFMILLMIWIRGTTGYDLRIAIFKITGDGFGVILSSNLYLNRNIDMAIVYFGIALLFVDIVFLISFLKMRKEALKS